MSILITGSEGFLGSQLAARLHAAGEDVVGLDVARGSDERPWPVAVGDVTDRALVEMLFAENDVTSVVHGGGISGPHICNQDPARVFNVNVLGTLNLFEVARLRRMPGRIVFISSSSAYGEAAEAASCVTPVVEGLPLLASEPYGCSKVACEALARAYVRQSGVDAVCPRVSIVYGAGRTAYCGITRMLKCALAGDPVPLDDGADVPLPWVYIDDLCAALEAALTTPRQSLREVDTLAYNVTGPGYPTFREIAAVVQRLVPGATLRATGEPDKYAMNARKMSLAAIRRDLGWEPRVGIEEGVSLLFDALTASQLGGRRRDPAAGEGGNRGRRGGGGR
jgi:nucleoside-diphosphate-sugar epimerase